MSFVGIICLGGGGGSIAAEYAKEFGKQDVWLIHGDNSAHENYRKKGFGNIMLAYGVCCGFGEGLLKKNTLDGLNNCSGQIESIMAMYPKIILVGGLGGGYANYAIPFMVKLANRLNVEITVVCSMPFELEGKERAKKAETAKKEILGLNCKAIVFELDSTISMLSKDTSMVAAFAFADKHIAKLIREQIETGGICRGTQGDGGVCYFV